MFSKRQPRAQIKVAVVPWCMHTCYVVQIHFRFLAIWVAWPTLTQGSPCIAAHPTSTPLQLVTSKEGQQCPAGWWGGLVPRGVGTPPPLHSDRHIPWQVAERHHSIHSAEEVCKWRARWGIIIPAMHSATHCLSRGASFNCGQWQLNLGNEQTYQNMHITQFWTQMECTWKCIILRPDLK